jgi:hypothetical protein
MENFIMKRTIVSILLVSAMCFIAASDSNQQESKAGCAYIIVLSTGLGNCHFIWCSDNGSGGSFTTDGSGNYTLNNLCLGTYYFCPQCNVSGTFVVVVDGTAIVYYNTAAVQVKCPCD